MDTALISIVCDEPSHKPGVRIADCFFSGNEWRLVRKGKHRLEEWSISEGRVVWSRIDGQQRDGQPATGDQHQRESLRCPRCRLSRTVRQSRLWPVLENLRHAGIESITLRAFGARFRSS